MAINYARSAWDRRDLVALLDRKAGPLWASLVAGIGAVWLGFAFGADWADQANLAARWTARVALPFFLVAFAARALAKLWPGSLTRALLRRRRQWGLGFALAHFIHLGALWYYITIAAPQPERLSPAQAISENVGGIVIFVFIILMAATSNDASVRLLKRLWSRLHLLGGYAIWSAFMLAYGGRIFNDDPQMQITGAVFTPMLLAALGLRLFARFGRR